MVRKVKNVVKATPFYAWSKRVYRKVMEGEFEEGGDGAGDEGEVEGGVSGGRGAIGGVYGATGGGVWGDFR